MSFEWMTVVTVGASGIATWFLIVIGLLRMNRKIFSPQSKLKRLSIPIYLRF